MADIDDFATLLLEQAKYYFENSKGLPSPGVEQAHLNAALLLGVASVEAHVNAIAEELLIRDDLTVLERSLLCEVEYELKKGTFSLRKKLKMYRLEDRIEFIFCRFTKVKVPSQEPWWSGLAGALSLRNRIVHAKSAETLTEGAVNTALTSVLDFLNALYRALYKKGYPGYARGLHSSLA